MYYQEPMNINLTDNITLHFKWYEALYLPSWDVYVFPNTSTVKDNINLTAVKLELIRAFLNCPLKVTSWYRPPHYNLAIGGAKKSAHMQGKACDFVPIGMDVQVAKQALLQKLEEFDIRMENNGQGNWIHIDTNKVIYNRYFLP